MNSLFLFPLYEAHSRSTNIPSPNNTVTATVAPLMEL